MTSNVKKTITVAELKRMLDARVINPRDDEELVIRRHLLSVSIGGTPCVPIVGLHHGFDWDAGKMFLEPAIPMTAAGPDFDAERKSHRDLSERLGWIMNILNSKSPDAEKLKAIRAQVLMRHR